MRRKRVWYAEHTCQKTKLLDCRGCAEDRIRTQARNEALEEAAKVALSQDWEDLEPLARAIRELKR